jgi:hypothetical protein
VSEHAGHVNRGQEVQDAARFRPLMPILAVVGLAALGAAAALAFVGDDPHAGKRLGLAYLTGFACFLTVSVGALFFVIIQHLTRAGWSVTIRRLAECMAMNIWLMLILFIPILISAPALYHWAHPGDDPILLDKVVWLNWPFWSFRHIVLWFGPWCVMALWLWRSSLRQDRTGDVQITERLERRAGLAVVIFALATNFGYFDMLMTLDPHWYSTMFGVYAFAGSFLNFFAMSILLFRFMQGRGVVTQSINREHYHDMGKFMFAFIFFWSYVAFSQWMLIWYANMPEETAWFAKRGATTSEMWAAGPWGAVALLLLLGHGLIPFALLLSRKFKRRLPILTFFAAWMFVMHFADMFWIVMPEVAPDLDHTGAEPLFGKSLGLAVLCWIGVGGLWLAGVLWFALKGSLVPQHDPRIGEALSYEVY